MDNVILTKMVQLWQMAEIELCPFTDFIFYIFKDIARDLVLGYSNQIIFTFQIANFRDPNRVCLFLPYFPYILEVF